MISAIVGFFYIQPIALASFLLGAKLVYFRENVYVKPSTRAMRLHRTIWWIQATTTIVLLVTLVIIGLAASGRVVHAVSATWIFCRALLTCYIGLFVFFMAGLLPDPDQQFEPGRPNQQSWILAGMFEVATMIVLGLQSSSINVFEKIWFALTLLRLILLATMIVLLVTASRPLCELDEEEDPLLPREKPADAQRIGWLNYFVGFCKLVPYLWSVTCPLNVKVMLMNRPSNSVRHRIIMIVCFFLLVGGRVINVLVPRQLGNLIDAFGKDHIPYGQIALYCLYRVLQGQQGVISSIRSILWIPVGQLIYRQLSSSAFEHILMLSLDFHLSKRIGEVMAALNKGNSLNTFLDSFAFQLFPMIVDLGVAAVYFFFSFDSFYSIVVLGVMWCYVFVTIYMARYRGRARREMIRRERQIDAAKTDALMAYETVHYNGATSLEVSRLDSLIDHYQKAEYFVQFSLNSLNAIQNLIFIVGVIIFCLLSGYQISIGQQRVSDFVMLITYFTQLQAPLAFFGSFYTQVQNNLVDAERMLEIFNLRSDVVDRPEARDLKSYNGAIRFENVSFTYASGKSALKNVSFAIEPGTTIAIVGESGSGKSTILKLLFHFYTPTEGSISFDHLETRDITMESLRAYIGVVPQDTILFNDTIMYNLRYADPNASDDEIYDACRVASIDSVIRGFPEGYNTPVGERGLKLSGGEKQRISIARAVLKRPQIMLLDEATASLDTRTEKQIQEALELATKGRTTIAIAHRLSTITQADQILVMHDGEIVERGTHSTLIRRHGVYRAMWDKQTLTDHAESTSFEARS